MKDFRFRDGIKINLKTSEIDEYKEQFAEFPLLTREQEIDKFKEFNLYKQGYVRACLKSEPGLEIFIKHYEEVLSNRKRVRKSRKQDIKATYKEFIKKVETNLETLKKIRRRIREVNYHISKSETREEKEASRARIKRHSRNAAELIEELIRERKNTPLGSNDEEVISLSGKIYRELEANSTKLRIVQKRYERYKHLKDELTQSNLRLVFSIAKSYRSRSLSFLDIIQEGNIGLMHAVERFDYKRGYKLSTFAINWIKQAIYRALTGKTGLIKIPPKRQENNRKINRVKNELLSELEREPELEEIAEEAGLETSKVLLLSDIFRRKTLSMETPVGLLKKPLIDTLTSSEPEDILYFYSEVERALNKLPERSRRVLELHFGLNGNKMHTLEKIGDKYGLTRERIRQIENKSLEKILYYLTRPEHLFKTG